MNKCLLSTYQSWVFWKIICFYQICSKWQVSCWMPIKWFFFLKILVHLNSEVIFAKIRKFLNLEKYTKSMEKEYFVKKSLPWFWKETSRILVGGKNTSSCWPFCLNSIQYFKSTNLVIQGTANYLHALSVKFLNECRFLLVRAEVDKTSLFPSVSFDHKNLNLTMKLEFVFLNFYENYVHNFMEFLYIIWH